MSVCKKPTLIFKGDKYSNLVCNYFFKLGLGQLNLATIFSKNHKAGFCIFNNK